MIRTKISEILSSFIGKPYGYGAMYYDNEIIDCLSLVALYLKKAFKVSLCSLGMDYEKTYKYYIENPNAAMRYGASFLRDEFESDGLLRSEGDIIVVSRKEYVPSTTPLGIGIYAGFNRMVTVYESLGCLIVSTEEYDIREVFKCHKRFR